MNMLINILGICGRLSIMHHQFWLNKNGDYNLKPKKHSKPRETFLRSMRLKIFWTWKGCQSVPIDRFLFVAGAFKKTQPSKHMATTWNLRGNKFIIHWHIVVYQKDNQKPGVPKITGNSRPSTYIQKYMAQSYMYVYIYMNMYIYI